MRARASSASALSTGSRSPNAWQPLLGAEPSLRLKLIRLAAAQRRIDSEKEKNAELARMIQEGTELVQKAMPAILLDGLLAE